MFGCVCFVHDLSPRLNKLYARAVKCVFLGYSRLQKWYRCYSPEPSTTCLLMSPLNRFPSLRMSKVFLPLVESSVSRTPDNLETIQNPPEPSSPPLITY